MNGGEIKIITLGDIFRNLETEEQAFEFLKYIKNLQQENQKYKEVIDKAIEFTNKKWGTWCTHHLEYMTELQNILKEASK